MKYINSLATGPFLDFETLFNNSFPPASHFIFFVRIHVVHKYSKRLSIDGNHIPCTFFVAKMFLNSYFSGSRFNTMSCESLQKRYSFTTPPTSVIPFYKRQQKARYILAYLPKNNNQFVGKKFTSFDFNICTWHKTIRGNKALS